MNPSTVTRRFMKKKGGGSDVSFSVFDGRVSAPPRRQCRPPRFVKWGEPVLLLPSATEAMRKRRRRTTESGFSTTETRAVKDGVFNFYAPSTKWNIKILCGETASPLFYYMGGSFRGGVLYRRQSDCRCRRQRPQSQSSHEW